MVVLLELMRCARTSRTEEHLLEDNVRFFEDGWILDKNLVACLRI